MSPNIWLFVRALRFQESLDRAGAGGAHSVGAGGQRASPALLKHRP